MCREQRSKVKPRCDHGNVTVLLQSTLRGHHLMDQHHCHDNRITILPFYTHWARVERHSIDGIYLILNTTIFFPLVIKMKLSY